MKGFCGRIQGGKLWIAGLDEAEAQRLADALLLEYVGVFERTGK